MTVIDILLKKRGLHTQEQINEFYHPESPLNMALVKTGIKTGQIKTAVKAIKAAIKDNRPIYVYGDFDADGITATAVLWETLFKLKAKAMPLIGGRSEPVRGLSVKGIKDITPKSLVITVDNGITSFEAADYCRKNDIGLIITDHHLPRDNKLPQAIAIVHSTQLCGAGVAWFLARELDKKIAEEELDLVAVGTIADMVPLLSINRSLVKFGMEKLKSSKRPGMKLLAGQAQIDLSQVTPHQVSFSLAPRLNAMGRLDSSLDALRLLCTHDPVRAGELAERFIAVNQRRQDDTQLMFIDAKKQAQKVKNKPLIFIQSKDYHEGLVGLVAGRLAEEFHRPAVVVAIGPEHAKGSARSIKGFDAIAEIRKISDLMMEHGGHPLAAGFTADKDKLAEIQKKLEAAAAKLTDKDLEPEVTYDCDLELSQADWNLYQELEKFEPFGFGNPVPVFRAQKVKVVSFYPVGQENRHLKLKLQGETLKAFGAIAFGKGALANQLNPGQLVDITYNLEPNVWNGKKSLELKVKEISV